MRRSEIFAPLLRGALAAVMLLAVAGAIGRGVTRPSFLLVVLDTVRADAVLGPRAAGATPVLDGLAEGGLRFDRAYAQAHWTLPSHVTLFTGLIPSHHGVDVHRMRAPDDLVMIAERFAAAGYETFGVSENPLLAKPLNVIQGFAGFRTVPMGSEEMLPALVEWLGRRDVARPFFLFVNVMDAHAPYDEPGVEKSFLPPDAAVGEIAAVTRKVRRFRLCQTVFDEREQAILRGQYLGGVAAADAKLGRVLALVRDEAAAGRLVVVVTSDHGESLGEHGLIHHDYGLWEHLIRVPLVVTGLPGVTPAAISTPVELTDVTPSLLEWADLGPPEATDGRLLPTREGAAEPRAIVAEHVEPKAVAGWGRLRRDLCDPLGPLFGDQRVAVDGRWKLHSYEAPRPPRLYDLDADPGEALDLASAQAARVAELTMRVAAERSSKPAVRAAVEGAPASHPEPEVLERLRALGYAGDIHGDAAEGGEP